MLSQNKDLIIGGVSILAGRREKVELSVAKLYDYTQMKIPVEVIRGKEDGPTLFISAAIHGDEINGVEIIKRILSQRKMLSKIKGTLIAVPIVNVFGFNSNSRYLPDRRDLNRSFPGHSEGSLAGQVAHTFMKEIVSHCTHGIDLHTGAIHRCNLPQIRAGLADPETKRLALSFGVPVVLDSNIRDGSLRQAAFEKGIPTLLFEGGEALRYDQKVILSGVKGILSVMKSIGMIENNKVSLKKKETFVAESSHWVRAPHSGSLQTKKKLGVFVDKGQLLGILSNPFGIETVEVRSHKKGIIVGLSMLPLVNRGDALFHIATFGDSRGVEERVEAYEDDLERNDIQGNYTPPLQPL